MSDWQIGILIKPLLLLALMILIVWPIKWVLFKIMPEGKIKKLLFGTRWRV